MHVMTAFDQILQDNMAGVANPSGWIPPTHALADLPPTLQAVDDSGADTADTVAGFFFTDTGRGPSGNRLALKDTAGRRLAVGYLGALWPFSGAGMPAAGPVVFAEFDLRQKTTHLVGSPAEFAARFLRPQGGRTVLDLQGGIVTVRGGDLTLGGAGGPLTYREGGMLIVEDGRLLLGSSLTREASAQPPAPLTLATAKAGKDIVFAGATVVEAFLISSGTLKRTAGNGIRVRGGAAVRTLDFRESAADSLFRGHPAAADERNTIVWDPVFNIFDPATRRAAVRLHLGGRRSYWRSDPG